MSSKGKPPSLTGNEPTLGDGSHPSFTGFEPTLGGIWRTVNIERIQILLDAANVDERNHAIETVRFYAQEAIYARQLEEVIRPRARHRIGNWRGTFTPMQRIGGLEALALLGDHESIPALLHALKDRTYRQVQVTAGQTLKTICDRLDPDAPTTPAAYLLLAQSLSSLPLYARNIVVENLASGPPNSVLPALLNEGLVSEAWEARRESARALGKHGDRRATVRLMKVLESDPSLVVRGMAAWALGRLDAPIAIPLLITCATHPDEVFRSAVVESLGALTVRLHPDEAIFKEAIYALDSALKDDKTSVRLAAYEALKLIKEPEARTALYAFLNPKG